MAKVDTNPESLLMSAARAMLESNISEFAALHFPLRKDLSLNIAGHLSKELDSIERRIQTLCTVTCQTDDERLVWFEIVVSSISWDDSMKYSRMHLKRAVECPHHLLASFKLKTDVLTELRLCEEIFERERLRTAEEARKVTP